MVTTRSNRVTSPTKEQESRIRRRRPRQPLVIRESNEGGTVDDIDMLAHDDDQVAGDEEGDECVVVVSRSASRRKREKENVPIDERGHCRRREDMWTPSKDDVTIGRNVEEEDEEQIGASPTKKRKLTHTMTIPPSTEQVSSPSPTTGPSTTLFPHVYAHARHLLRLSTTTAATTTGTDKGHGQRLEGRERERSLLLDFLSSKFPLRFSRPPSSSFSPRGEGATESETNDKSNSIYISGQPGTGKTALIKEVLADHQLTETETETETGSTEDSPKVAMINCVSLGDRVEEVWDRLLEGLERGAGSSKDRKGSGGRDRFETLVLREYENDQSKFLVVLDEVDHLLPSTIRVHQSSKSSPSRLSTSRSQILSSLFEIANLPGSNLVLIGIANSLDFTERNLISPLLDSANKTPTKKRAMSASERECDEEARPQLPLTIHFEPYKAQDMISIIRQRLSNLQPSYPQATTVSLPSSGADLFLMMPMALELCAKKVAAVTGDVRTMLDIVRKSIEFVEQEQAEKAARDDGIASGGLPTPDTTPTSKGSRSLKRRSSSILSASSGPGLLSHLTPATAPKVTPSHVLRAIRLAKLGSKDETSARVGELNLQERLTLTCLAISFRRKRGGGEAADVMVGTKELYGVYRDLLSKEGLLDPVGFYDFLDLVGGLQVRGLTKVSSPGGGAGGTSAQVVKGLPSPLSTPTKKTRTFPPRPKSISPLSKKSPGSSKSKSSASYPTDTSNSLLSLPHALALDKLESYLTTAGSGSEEVSRMCVSLLTREEREAKRMRSLKGWRERDEEAPMVGFGGNGLDGRDNLIGGKRRGLGEEEE